MSVYFISDPHLGHKAIAKYRPFVSSVQDNTQQFVYHWQRTIDKKDVVYMLGDVAFDLESLQLLKTLKGRKILIKGNHDDMVSTVEQSKVFEAIHGLLKYKGMWLSHCPIHPDEMRARKGNVCGHIHQNNIMKGWGPFKREDPRYFNACVDNVWPRYNSWFVTLDQVRDHFKKHGLLTSS